MLPLQIVPDDGDPFEVTVTSRDVYLWEKDGRGRSFKRAMETLSFQDLYPLAYAACRRHQLFTGSLDEFVASVDLVPRKARQAPDPTPEAASPESVSPSRSPRASQRSTGRKTSGAS